MSEGSKDSLYSKDSHPHTGDPRVDPRARKNRPPVAPRNQETLDSLFVTPVPSSESRRKMQKPTFYTVKAGIDYSTAPRGSEQGSPLAGRFESPTRIKVLSRRVVSGEASVFAEFIENGETKRAWVAVDDFRTKKK